MSDSVSPPPDLLKEFLYGPPNITIPYLVAAIFAAAYQSDKPKELLGFATDQLASMTDAALEKAP